MTGESAVCDVSGVDLEDDADYLNYDSYDEQ
jgi:hypothetical protein